MNITTKEVVEQSKASIVKSDLSILFNIVLPLGIKNVLEIGAWRGYSASVWINAFKPETFLTIEKDIVDIREEYIKGLRYQYWYNTDSHGGDVIKDIKIYFPEGFDFLFIDGDHGYEGVKQDWEMYSPLVRKAGVVVFHDTCYLSDDPLSPVQVIRFWEELKKTHNYVEIKSSPTSTGIGVIFI